MRKFGISFAAVLVSIAAMFTVAGCDALEVLKGPENTWCFTEVNYGDNENAKLNVAFIYTDDTLEGTGKGSYDLKAGTNIERGITVVIWAKQDIESLGLSTSQYCLKNYSSTSSLLNDSGWESTASNMELLWSAIYWAKSDFRDSETQLEHPKAPVPLAKNSNAISIEDIKDIGNSVNFTWKDLLKSVVNAL